MRKLRKVFNPVSGMKSEKDIEKGYRKIVSAYEVLHAKSQQMREEAEKTILYERMLDFARTLIFPPKSITAEDLKNEYWKIVQTKCRQELKAIRASITDFDKLLTVVPGEKRQRLSRSITDFDKLLTSLSTKYPDESQLLVELRESVEKEREQEDMKLLRETNDWSQKQSK